MGVELHEGEVGDAVEDVAHREEAAAAATFGRVVVTCTVEVPLDQQILILSKSSISW